MDFKIIILAVAIVCILLSTAACSPVKPILQNKITPPPELMHTAPPLHTLGQYVK